MYLERLASLILVYHTTTLCWEYPLDLSLHRHLQREQSMGSNSNAGKLDQTRSRIDPILINL